MGFKAGINRLYRFIHSFTIKMKDEDREKLQVAFDQLNQVATDDDYRTWSNWALLFTEALNALREKLEGDSRGMGNLIAELEMLRKQNAELKQQLAASPIPPAAQRPAQPVPANAFEAVNTQLATDPVIASVLQAREKKVGRETPLEMLIKCLSAHIQNSWGMFYTGR